MNYYSMAYARDEDDIVIESSQLLELSPACTESAFQLLDREPEELKVSGEKGGFHYPDFYYQDGVPLFRRDCYNQLQELLTGCFIKTIYLKDPDSKVRQEYRLVLPERIDALNLDHTRLGENFGTEERPLYQVKKTVLKKECSGRFHIFKLKGALDNRIMVTEEFRRCVNEMKTKGIDFLRIRCE